MNTALVQDCATCGGKCCAGWAVEIVPTQDSVPINLTKWDPLLGTIMRERNGACIALKNGRCSIYDQRPGVCRDFKLNGSDCQKQQRLPWKSLLKKVRK